MTVTTDLDAALAQHPPDPETARSVVRSDRRCARHRWQSAVWPEVTRCRLCGARKDETLSRQGRSSARLGKDQERRAERRYGWTKIGERGEKTDLRGRLFKVQQKSSRRQPPALVRDTFAGLDATRDGRVPLLLLTFVRPGVPADDYIVIRGSDWLDLHGQDREEPTWDPVTG